jgi:hypothetical protein
VHCFRGKEKRKRKVNKKDFNTKMENTDFVVFDGPRENVFFLSSARHLKKFTKLEGVKKNALSTFW